MTRATRLARSLPRLLGRDGAAALPRRCCPAPRVAAQDDILSHFKYGSVGTEVTVGLPYPIWRVLPVLFADKLPNRPGQGYERLGFIFESESAAGPARSARRYVEDRVPLVGLNCATCHTGTVREIADEPAADHRRHAGAPDGSAGLRELPHRVRPSDPRFEAGTLIEAIRKQDPEFSWFTSLLYRFVVVKRTRDGILERAKQNAWFDDRPPQGPGRVDTFNPYKRIFNFDLKADKSVGTADLPPLFNQRVRQGLWLHWDGNNNQVEERNKSAAIGAGRDRGCRSISPRSTASRKWALDLKPPAYPAGAHRSTASVDKGSAGLPGRLRELPRP